MTAQKVLNLSDLEQDTAVRVEIDGVPIAVVLDSNGDISLSEGFVEGETLECWAHGSAFSLRTGRPLNLPAYEPVPVYDVTIDGDDILIDPAVTKEVN
jgi:3-phenylpropionate/trans-cinnamate dioxygenase ferredoxin subunit